MKSELGAIIYDHDPSPETQYGMELEYLVAICKLMTEKSPQYSIEYICSEIRNTVTKLWENEIKEDYLNGHLLREDTLKNSMYYPIRRKLGPLFNRNHIRIFTEYYMDDAVQKADLVIVRTEPWYQPEADKNLPEAITDILAVFEVTCSPDLYSSGEHVTSIICCTPQNIASGQVSLFSYLFRSSKPYMLLN